MKSMITYLICTEKTRIWKASYLQEKAATSAQNKKSNYIKMERVKIIKQNLNVGALYWKQQKEKK